MSNGYRVSVVISILNGAEYIDRIVDSLCNQTFTDFETILVVDEKSTDNFFDKG